MKKFLLFYLLLLFLFSNAVQARTWTDSKGRTVTADYAGISETDSSKVKLKMANGTVYNVSISSLSKEDQAYIKSLNKGSSSPHNGFASDEDEGDDSNPNNVVVVVEGAGETLAEAKKDALRCAVEEVIGSLVDTQSRMENDELIEQVLTASSAYVEKYSVLDRKIENGVATVKIRATVVKASLTKKIKQSGGGQTVAIDGASLAGKVATKSESEKNGAMFLANFLRKEEFPYNLLDVKIVGQPQITQTGNDIKIDLNWEVSVNRERYMDFVKRLQPILDKYALRKNSFTLDLEQRLRKNCSMLREESLKDDYVYLNWSSKQIDSLADKPNLQFYLCTGITENFHSLKYESYELPQKFKIPIQYYCRVVIAVNLTLLNSKSNVIKNKISTLCFRDIFNYPYPFNLFVPLNSSSLEFKYNENTTESTISTYYYRDVLDKCWFSISPILRNDCYHFYGSTYYYRFYSTYPFTSSFTITSEELEQVKSATISVISNNPDMDKAFERMPNEIDKVPTE